MTETADDLQPGGGQSRVLITGAGGFVGRHLAQLLSANADQTIIGLEARPGPLLPGVRRVVCDLTDADLTLRVVRHYRPELIFHLAAQSYVPQSLANPAATLVNNLVSQVNLFEACRAAQIDPVILVVSSSEVYGAADQSRQPITEDAPFRPANPYAVSKVSQDMLGLQYYLSYGMRIVRVRPFNHVGPGQSDRFAVSSFARQIAEAEIGRSQPVMLVGNLEARRDFLDVRDVVRAYVLAADARFVGDVFNVATGSARSVRCLLDELLSLSRVEIAVRQDPARIRPVDVPVIAGDATRLRQATGWRPVIPIEQSLADTLDDWRDRLHRAS